MSMVNPCKKEGGEGGGGPGGWKPMAERRKIRKADFQSILGAVSMKIL